MAGILDPIGIGVVILEDGKELDRFGRGFPKGTNNQAELLAIREAAYAVSVHPEIGPGVSLSIISDSEYAILMCRSHGNPKKNPQLVREVREALSRFQSVKFTWVKGHIGNEWNEVANTLAESASRAKK